MVSTTDAAMASDSPKIVLEIISMAGHGGLIAGTNDKSQTLRVSQADVRTLLGHLIKPKSLVGAKSPHGDGALSSDISHDKNFWKDLHACLADGSIVSLNVAPDDTTAESLAKMHGFTDVVITGGQLTAKKPAVKAGGTLLKRGKKGHVAPSAAAATTEANPWAALGQTDSNQIDEDSLMKDESAIEKVTAKFTGDADRVMPGKPCDNCTCGAKEVYEGTMTAEQLTEKLETGQIESSCGKCYLGDAFRCASCPFLGKPAFEAGDKVKLQNADVA